MLTGSSTSVTIGETNVLSTGDGGNGNLLAAQNATLSQPATINSLSFYVTQMSGNLILGIYDASGPNGGPGALKAQTNSFTPVSGWNTANVITPVSLPAGTYWLAYLPSSNTLAFVKGLTSGISNRYYSYPFGALPAQFSTSPSSDASHWSLYATLNSGAVSQSISSVSLSKSSFVGGSPSGTGVGPISVTMSPSSPAFSGSLSLSTTQGGCTATNGANNSSFAISGGNLVTNGTVAPGTYAVCILATQAGATNSPFGQAVTITGSSQSISAISLSKSSFVGGSPPGTVVGTINVTISPSSPAFSGALSLSTTQGGCTAVNGANNSSFAISGSNLVTNGVDTAGTYKVCIVATETGMTNSPFGQAETITGTPPTSTFPLTVSGGVLQTASGLPYMIIGDSPQAAINLPPLNGTGGTTADGGANWPTYLNDRAAVGFNTVWINVVCEPYTACPANGQDNAGNLPFTGQLSGTFNGETCPHTQPAPNVDCYDLSTASGATAYWSHIDSLISQAAALNMAVFINPIPTDSCSGPTGGSWMQTFVNNGQTKVNAFATFLANRYKNTPNVLWWFGNDYNCYNTAGTGNPTPDNFTFGFAQTIRSTDTNHNVLTMELNEDTVSLDNTTNNWAGLPITLNGSDGVNTYSVALRGYSQSATTPGIAVESAYQGEDDAQDDYTATGTNISGCGWQQIGPPGSSQGSIGGDPNACPLRQRHAYWWEFLSGGTAGFVDGNTFTWRFLTGWNTNGSGSGTTCTGTPPRACLDTRASTQLVNSANFLKNVRWYELVPDATYNGGSGGLVASPFLKSCYGGSCLTYWLNGVGNVMLVNPWVSSGTASDGTFSIAYVPGMNPTCNSSPSTCHVQGSQQITVDMSRVTAGGGGAALTAAWYDPTSAMTSPFQTLCSPTTTPCTSGTSVTFTTPSSTHSDGATDWVLLVNIPSGGPATISSISLSKSSFVGGSPSGTVVGTINVAMSPSSPAFSGSLSLSTTQGGCTATNGANNSSFAISGSNLVTNGTVAPGTYAVCILATQAGATNSPFGHPATITGSAQSISSISLSKSSFVGGSPSGTVVGTINVTMSPSSPAFSGSLSLSTTQGGCTPTNGANNSSFAISGSNLVTNGIVAPRSYAVCILATQASASNSPVGKAEAPIGSSTTAVSEEDFVDFGAAGSPTWYNVNTTGGCSNGGVTDVTTCLQSAINNNISGQSSPTHPVLYFPCGTYLIGSSGTGLTVADSRQVGMVGAASGGALCATLKWGGATTNSGTMLWVNNVGNARFDRLIFDGQGKASMLVDQSGDGTGGFFDTQDEYNDDIFKNSALVGIRCGAGSGAGGSAPCDNGHITRSTFQNNVSVGFITCGGGNAVNHLFMWDTFANERVGVGDFVDNTALNANICGTGVNGGNGIWASYNNNFSGSTVADSQVNGRPGQANVMAGSYSNGSNQFINLTGGYGTPSASGFAIWNNTIVNPTTLPAIYSGGTGPYALFNNNFYVGASGSTVVQMDDTGGQGDVFAMNNLFAATNLGTPWSGTCGATSPVRNTRVASQCHELSETINSSQAAPSAPALPGLPPTSTRPIHTVAPGGNIQAAINSAVTDCSTKCGVVYLQAGNTNVSSTLTIPGNDQIEIIGDSQASTISWNGANNGTVIQCGSTGVGCKAVFREFTISGGNGSATAASALVLNGADQAGGYVQIADANITNNCTTNVNVNGLNSTNVEIHGGQLGGGAGGGCPLTSIQVSGGANGGKFSQFGGTNVTALNVAESGSANVFLHQWMDSGNDYVTVTGNGSFIDVAGNFNQTTTPAMAFTNFSGKAAFLVPYGSNAAPNITPVGFSGTGGANWFSVGIQGGGCTPTPCTQSILGTDTATGDSWDFLGGYQFVQPFGGQTRVADATGGSGAATSTFIAPIVAPLATDLPTYPTGTANNVTDAFISRLSITNCNNGVVLNP
jgi:hypothetical protein